MNGTLWMEGKNALEQNFSQFLKIWIFFTAAVNSKINNSLMVPATYKHYKINVNSFMWTALLTGHSVRVPATHTHIHTHHTVF